MEGAHRSRGTAQCLVWLVPSLWLTSVSALSPQVDWANKSDFKFFDWKWTEGDEYESPAPKDTRDGDAYSRSP